MMNITGLMCVGVLEKLLATNQVQYLALCRSAGSVGYDAFEEVVRRGLVALCMEVPPTATTTPVDDDQPEEQDHAPIFIEEAGDDAPSNEYNTDLPLLTLVASLPALVEQQHELLQYYECGYVPTRPFVFGHLRITHVTPALHDLHSIVFNIVPEHVTLTLDHRYVPTTTTIVTNSKTVADAKNGSLLLLENINWFCGCDDLGTCDISSASGLIRTVGDHYLGHARSLKQLDMTPFMNVVEIGQSFASGTTSLTGTLDLSTLTSLRKIGMCFCKATGLSEVILPPLSTSTSSDDNGGNGYGSITEVGDMFLSGAQNLTKIDLTPLSQLTVVSGWFLEKCVSLTDIVSSQPFSRVDNVGPHFLEGCSGLKHITIPSSSSSSSSTIDLMVENVNTVAASMGATTVVVVNKLNNKNNSMNIIIYR